MEKASKRFKPPRNDLTGARFGKLTVMCWVGESKWSCRCDCGRYNNVITANLNRGNTSSCGCVRNIKSSKRATKHGLSGTPAHRTWQNIRRRCREKGHPSYPTYGGKGIDIYQPWFESVEVFVSAVGQPPTLDHTLDRIDNSKGYEPGNVRWATPTEQARNRSVCRKVSFQGNSFPSLSAFIEWLAPQIGMNPRSIKRELVGREWP